MNEAENKKERDREMEKEREWYKWITEENRNLKTSFWVAKILIITNDGI